MKKHSYLFIIVGILVLISCGRQVSCPKFEEEILSWMPYQEEDVIELYSQSNDSTIIFSISSIEVIHTTHYLTNADCGTCDDQILINQKDYSEYKPNFEAHISLNKNRIQFQYYIINDTYFSYDNSDYSELTSFEFENNVYDIVRVFEKNDSKGAFKKLILAKDIGIIGLIDFDGNTWTLKNNGKTKSIKQKKIKINDTSCG